MQCARRGGRRRGFSSCSERDREGRRFLIGCFLVRLCLETFREVLAGTMPASTYLDSDRYRYVSILFLVSDHPHANLFQCHFTKYVFRYFYSIM